MLRRFLAPAHRPVPSQSGGESHFISAGGSENNKRTSRLLGSDDTATSKTSFVTCTGSPSSQDYNPPNNLSVPTAFSLLPGGSSGSGGSEDLSSDCSSYGHLTPPESTVNPEKAPYKAPSSSDPSLRMLSAGRRAQSLPVVSSKRYRRHHRRRGCNERGTIDGSNSRLVLDIPRSKVPIQSSEDDLQLRYPKINNCSEQGFGEFSHQKPVQSLEREIWLSAGLLCNPAPPITTRRWTSVGVDFESNAENSPTVPGAAHLRRNHEQLWSSQTSQSHLIGLVRSHLSARRVSLDHLDTPATITLRRASDGEPSRFTRKQATFSRRSDGTASTSASDYMGNNRPVAAYIITNRDIDRISDLLESAIPTSNKCGKSSGHLAPTKSVQIFDSTPRKPSVARHGIMPSLSESTAAAITISEIGSVSMAAKDQSPLTEQSQRRLSTISRVYTRNGVNEIIWENENCDITCPPLQKHRRSTLAGHSTYLTSGTSTNSTRSELPMELPRKTSTEENLPSGHQSDIAFSGVAWSLTDRDGDKSEKIHGNSLASQRSKSKRHDTGYNPRLSSTDSQAEVISFPPLPMRKDTTDWITPLPGMNERRSNAETCPYTRGFDIHTGPPRDVPNSQPKLTPHLEVNSAANEKGFEYFLDPDFVNHEPTKPSSEKQTTKIDGGDEAGTSCNLKSIIFRHPESLHRTGETFRLGSALGASGHARRRSSVPGLRVQIDEGRTEAAERRNTWKKPRKDSGWPVPRSPTPDSGTPSRSNTWKDGVISEPERRHSEGNGKIKARQPSWGRDTHGHRLVQLEERSPMLVDADDCDTYALMSGARMSEVDTLYGAGYGDRDDVESGDDTRHPNVNRQH